MIRDDKKKIPVIHVPIKDDADLQEWANAARRQHISLSAFAKTALREKIAAGAALTGILREMSEKLESMESALLTVKQSLMQNILVTPTPQNAGCVVITPSPEYKTGADLFAEVDGLWEGDGE